MRFIYSVRSEWLKMKGSAASWLCVIGGFFIPTIYLLGFIKNQTSINTAGTNMWEMHFWRLWMNMAGFLLPMGVILASSLITQMEYKNNTWKQLHTTPQSFTTIFLSKLSVILLMMFKFFIFFNLGIILSGVIPCLLFDHQLPSEPIPMLYFLKRNGNFFLTCLPIIALQYLVSLRFKNFLVPIGVGLLGLVGTLIAFKWKFIYISPFSYSSLYIRTSTMNVNSYILSSGYFVGLVVVSYILYIKNKVKG
jgi:lantibiotic transport system permease protein